MDYVKPQLNDLGTLVDMTEAGGSIGFEDGAAKHITVNVGGLAGLSVTLLP